MDEITLRNWFRRLVLCCNDTADVLRLLPDPSDDIINKYSIIQFAGNFKDDTENKITIEKCEKELAAFSYYLLNEWNIPDWIKHDTRMGIASHHNEVLSQMIYECSNEATLWEHILNVMRRKNVNELKGTGAELHNQIDFMTQQTSIKNNAWATTRANKFCYDLRALKKNNDRWIDADRKKDATYFTITLPDNSAAFANINNN
jgi:hypothetical protein